MKKMTLNDLKSLFPAYEPNRYKPEKATKKGVVHNHRPTYKPPKADRTPAQWKEMRRKMTPKQWAAYVHDNIKWFYS